MREVFTLETGCFLRFNLFPAKTRTKRRLMKGFAFGSRFIIDGYRLYASLFAGSKQLNES